ncbi:zinc dependent phospholipase C family protein [Romboutsia sp. 1001216sp1]|nr:MULTISPECIES: zinc dependent phospholipase C family protein [Romboutsia]MDB8793349.1 zinc dependent phospholipase C family protein [Romboutsia sp. 1001216sp1]MDB8796776.1 zinc dependent phospholipase C family protein [Romboutsia sp. 1001216sp1]MDB8799637.1 zinc dependent phospholipase C family protein [Romboutsia sp. 1001216sp1]MDB8802423.1 zinc dependent phospholipase C family protein [Romboutsia sp. 1001216sp1]MDB8805930.1 zinc dependent phospholipase C family protein [Romboutsia sp. 1001
MIRNIKKNSAKAFVISMLFVAMGSTSYAWDGKKDGTGTHALIATQAVKMIEKDLSKSEPQLLKSNLDILKSNLRDLQLGSTYPDYDPNAYDLYQDHFWDPDTKNNFTLDNKWYVASPIYDNAESQVRKFTTDAKNEWEKGNYKEATFLLGQGLHYLGDLNTPYHAANITAVDSIGHVKFESYVEERKENYAIDSMNYNTENGAYKYALENKDFDAWMSENSYEYAKKAKNLYYGYSTMKNSTKDWEYSAVESMKNSQISSAKLIYRFLNEVSNTIIDSSDTKNLNEFNVILKTSNEKYAGTDDFVYFGFETSDNKKYEWKLDNAGNDFEKGQIDNYIIKLKDGKNIDLSKINNFWIRKNNFVTNGDDWSVDNIKILSRGKVILEKNIHKTLRGNETYSINK